MPAQTDHHVGGTKHFECRVIGHPRPNIRWFKDGTEITDSPRYKFDHSNDGVISMVIHNITHNDEGHYRCRAENPEGLAYTSAYLLVRGHKEVPDEPTTSIHSMEIEEAVLYSEKTKRSQQIRAKYAEPYFETSLEDVKQINGRQKLDDEKKDLTWKSIETVIPTTPPTSLLSPTTSLPSPTSQLKLLRDVSEHESNKIGIDLLERAYHSSDDDLDSVRLKTISERSETTSLQDSLKDFDADEEKSLLMRQTQRLFSQDFQEDEDFFQMGFQYQSSMRAGSQTVVSSKVGVESSTKASEVILFSQTDLTSERKGAAMTEIKELLVQSHNEMKQSSKTELTNAESGLSAATLIESRVESSSSLKREENISRIDGEKQSEEAGVSRLAYKQDQYKDLSSNEGRLSTLSQEEQITQEISATVSEPTKDVESPSSPITTMVDVTKLVTSSADDLLATSQIKFLEPAKSQENDINSLKTISNLTVQDGGKLKIRTDPEVKTGHDTEVIAGESKESLGEIKLGNNADLRSDEFEEESVTESETDSSVDSVVITKTTFNGNRHLDQESRKENETISNKIKDDSDSFKRHDYTNSARVKHDPESLEENFGTDFRKTETTTKSLKVNTPEALKFDETKTLKLDETKTLKLDETESLKVDETKSLKVDETESLKVDDTKSLKVDETESLKLDETESLKVDETRSLKVDVIESLKENETMCPLVLDETDSSVDKENGLADVSLWKKGKSDIFPDTDSGPLAEETVEVVEQRSSWVEKVEKDETNLVAEEEATTRGGDKPQLIIEKPVIVQKMEDPKVEVGKILKLRSQVQASPGAEVEWSREGQLMEAGERITIVTEDDVYTLEIRDIGEADAGRYRMTAFNSAGSVFSEVLVHVITSLPSTIGQFSQDLSPALPVGYPQFVIQPQNVSVAEYERIKLTCSVTGDPVPKVSWEKDGEKVRANKRLRLYESRGVYYLEIPEAEAEDAGEYVCTATNSQGTISATISVSIEGVERVVFISGETEPADMMGQPSAEVVEGATGGVVESSSDVCISDSHSVRYLKLFGMAAAFSIAAFGVKKVLENLPK